MKRNFNLMITTGVIGVILVGTSHAFEAYDTYAALTKSGLLFLFLSLSHCIIGVIKTK